MLQRVAGDNGCVYYVSPILSRAGVPHAFSTRIGGVSSAPYDSLNLGNPSGLSRDQQDLSDHIAENYRRLHRAIGCESRQRCFVHQVHGGDVLRVSSTSGFSNGACADALITSDPAKLLAIRVADCVPILIATDDGSQVAAVHAGWRGVVANVLVNTINEMNVAPACLFAAIGPCIGFDAFEVGEEVLREFTRLFGKESPLRPHDTTPGKGFVNLRVAVRTQLLRAGLSLDRIDSTDRCTFHDADEFFSHRRDRGVTGRMAAVIGPCESDVRRYTPAHV
jgi:YfiH family protein